MCENVNVDLFFTTIQLAQELYDPLRCCICLELFEAPTSLRCNHTFCAQCLSQSNGKACPLCRKISNKRDRTRNQAAEKLCEFIKVVTKQIGDFTRVDVFQDVDTMKIIKNHFNAKTIQKPAEAGPSCNSPARRDAFDVLLSQCRREGLTNIPARRSYKNKNRVKIYTDKRCDFESEENRDKVLKWLTDSQNDFERLTQTQQGPSVKVEEGGEDIKSVSQRKHDEIVYNRKLDEVKRRRVELRQFGSFGLRCRSLEVQVRNRPCKGRLKRQSISCDSPELEEFESNKTENVERRVELIQKIEDECLRNLEGGTSKENSNPQHYQAKFNQHDENKMNKSDQVTNGAANLPVGATGWGIIKRLEDVKKKKLRVMKPLKISRASSLRKISDGKLDPNSINSNGVELFLDNSRKPGVRNNRRKRTDLSVSKNNSTVKLKKCNDQTISCDVSKNNTIVNLQKLIKRKVSGDESVLNHNPIGNLEIASGDKGVFKNNTIANLQKVAGDETVLQSKPIENLEIASGDESTLRNNPIEDVESRKKSKFSSDVCKSNATANLFEIESFFEKHLATGQCGSDSEYSTFFPEKDRRERRPGLRDSELEKQLDEGIELAGGSGIKTIEKAIDFGECSKRKSTSKDKSNEKLGINISGSYSGDDDFPLKLIKEKIGKSEIVPASAVEEVNVRKECSHSKLKMGAQSFSEDDDLPLKFIIRMMGNRETEAPSALEVNDLNSKKMGEENEATHFTKLEIEPTKVQGENVASVYIEENERRMENAVGVFRMKTEMQANEANILTEDKIRQENEANIFTGNKIRQENEANIFTEDKIRQKNEAISFTETKITEENEANFFTGPGQNTQENPAEVLIEDKINQSGQANIPQTRIKLRLLQRQRSETDQDSQHKEIDCKMQVDVDCDDEIFTIPTQKIAREHPEEIIRISENVQKMQEILMNTSFSSTVSDHRSLREQIEQAQKHLESLERSLSTSLAWRKQGNEEIGLGALDSSNLQDSLELQDDVHSKINKINGPNFHSEKEQMNGPNLHSENQHNNEPKLHSENEQINSVKGLEINERNTSDQMEKAHSFRFDNEQILCLNSQYHRAKNLDHSSERFEKYMCKNGEESIIAIFDGVEKGRNVEVPITRSDVLKLAYQVLCHSEEIEDSLKITNLLLNKHKANQREASTETDRNDFVSQGVQTDPKVYRSISVETDRRILVSQNLQTTEVSLANAETQHEIQFENKAMQTLANSAVEAAVQTELESSANSAVDITVHNKLESRDTSMQTEEEQGFHISATEGFKTLIMTDVCVQTENLKNAAVSIAGVELTSSFDGLDFETQEFNKKGADSEETVSQILHSLQNPAKPTYSSTIRKTVSAPTKTTLNLNKKLTMIGLTKTSIDTDPTISLVKTNLTRNAIETNPTGSVIESNITRKTIQSNFTRKIEGKDLKRTFSESNLMKGTNSASTSSSNLTVTILKNRANCNNLLIKSPNVSREILGSPCSLKNPVMNASKAILDSPSSSNGKSNLHQDFNYSNSAASKENVSPKNKISPRNDGKMNSAHPKKLTSNTIFGCDKNKYGSLTILSNFRANNLHPKKSSTDLPNTSNNLIDKESHRNLSNSLSPDNANTNQTLSNQLISPREIKIKSVIPLDVDIEKSMGEESCLVISLDKSMRSKYKRIRSPPESDSEMENFKKFQKMDNRFIREDISVVFDTETQNILDDVSSFGSSGINMEYIDQVWNKINNAALNENANEDDVAAKRFKGNTQQLFDQYNEELRNNQAKRTSKPLVFSGKSDNQSNPKTKELVFETKKSPPKAFVFESKKPPLKHSVISGKSADQAKPTPKEFVFNNKKSPLKQFIFSCKSDDKSLFSRKSDDKLRKTSQQSIFSSKSDDGISTANQSKTACAGIILTEQPQETPSKEFIFANESAVDLPKNEFFKNKPEDDSKKTFFRNESKEESQNPQDFFFGNKTIDIFKPPSQPDNRKMSQDQPIYISSQEIDSNPCSIERLINNELLNDFNNSFNKESESIFNEQFEMNSRKEVENLFIKEKETENLFIKEKESEDLFKTCLATENYTEADEAVADFIASSADDDVFNMFKSNPKNGEINILQNVVLNNNKTTPERNTVKENVTVIMDSDDDIFEQELDVIEATPEQPSPSSKIRGLNSRKELFPTIIEGSEGDFESIEPIPPPAQFQDFFEVSEDDDILAQVDEDLINKENLSEKQNPNSEQEHCSLTKKLNSNLLVKQSSNLSDKLNSNLLVKQNCSLSEKLNSDLLAKRNCSLSEKLNSDLSEQQNNILSENQNYTNSALLTLSPIAKEFPSKSVQLQPLAIPGRSKKTSSTPQSQKQMSIKSFMCRRSKSAKERAKDLFVVNPTKKACIACTRLNKDQLIAISALTNKKLATYSTVFNSSVTHMVVNTDENNCIDYHTIKFINAVASGIWVLNFKWVQDSLIKNTLLPEEPYEVLDVSGVDGPKQARLHSKTRKLFKGFRFYCAPPFICTVQADLEAVIGTLGGKIVNRPEELVPKNGDVCLIIIETRSTQDFALYESWLEDLGVVTVDMEWLSHCVGQFKLISFRNFALCSNNSFSEMGYPSELTATVPCSWSQDSQTN